MSRQYNNFVNNLQELSATVTTTLKEFTNQTDKSKKITFVCENDHETTIAITSLSNKLAFLKKGTIENICAQCIERISIEEETAKEKCKELKFTFLDYNKKERAVHCICTCGNELNIYISNLRKEGKTPCCIKCQGSSRKKSLQEIQEIFESDGCELLETEYNSKDVPLKYKCSCGTISKIRYQDFLDGKRCVKCKARKYKETCQENYGVDNMFQLEEIKEKSKKTLLKNKNKK